MEITDERLASRARRFLPGGDRLAEDIRRGRTGLFGLLVASPHGGASVTRDRHGLVVRIAGGEHEPGEVVAESRLIPPGAHRSDVISATVTDADGVIEMGGDFAIELYDLVLRFLQSS